MPPHSATLILKYGQECRRNATYRYITGFAYSTAYSGYLFRVFHVSQVLTPVWCPAAAALNAQSWPGHEGWDMIRHLIDYDPSRADDEYIEDTLMFMPDMEGDDVAAPC